jgi:hypothetical protein
MRSPKYQFVGDPVALAKVTERFWARVQKPDGGDGCWTWSGATESGYGVVGLPPPSERGLKVKAHVFSFWLHHGRWPREGLMVLHRCNNKECSRPSHLYEGNARDNARDWQAARNGELQLPAC